jgi:hypothetical protein
MGQALQALKQKSSQAADWYILNVQPDIDALSFAASEVMVI